MVKRTDRPDMTIAYDWYVKNQTKQIARAVLLVYTKYESKKAQSKSKTSSPACLECQYDVKKSFNDEQNHMLDDIFLYFLHFKCIKQTKRLSVFFTKFVICSHLLKYFVTLQTLRTQILLLL